MSMKDQLVNMNIHIKADVARRIRELSSDTDDRGIRKNTQGEIIEMAIAALERERKS